MNKRIEVPLTDDELKFIKWISKRDGVSVQEEMQMIFKTELRALIDLHESDMMEDVDNGN